MPLFKRSNSSRSFRYQSANANANTLSSESSEEAKRGFLDLNLGRNEENDLFAQTLSGINTSTSSSSSADARYTSANTRTHNVHQGTSNLGGLNNRAGSSASGSSSIPFQDPLTPPTSPLKTHHTYFMSRSKSQPQALPYHRPWNRNLSSVEAPVPEEETPSMIASQSLPGQTMKLSLSQSSYSNGSITSPSPIPIKDFRVSPYAFPSPTPAQRKQMIDTARRTTLRKAKAPSEYNILVMGAIKTGKTSWIRTMLSTMNLDACSDENILAAANFGISTLSNHYTRETDPITPLPTKTIQSLEGIELQPSSLLPLSSLAQGYASQHSKLSMPSHSSSRGSIFSSGTASGNKRVQLTMCDTPGIDFEYEDDFEIERKVAGIARHVEDKLAKTMNEEGKLARKSRNDSHIHLVLYFIDPLALVERRESRKKLALQKRLGQSEDKRRSRTQSESRSRSPGAFRKQVDHGLYYKDDATEQRSQEELEYGVDGLSEMELKILSKMSKLANVLPVIAKADTLSASQLLEVRQAVRISLKAAKIDLGVFDVASTKPKKKRSGPLKKSGSVEFGDGDGEDLNGAADDKENVKVIRLRSRRSYSAMEFKRMHQANAEKGQNGHSLQHTEPLFPDEAADPDALEEQEAHDRFMQSMPPAIFVPEPTRMHHQHQQQQQQQQQRRKKSSSASKYAIGEKSPFRVPPVPAIPADLSNSSDLTDGQQYSRSEIGTAMSPEPEEMPPTPSQQLPHAPPASARFERNYRWGSASVLDADQCDFGLLRDTILGTHAETLKDSTSLRYEAFRTERLEFKESLRQGKSGYV